jgi:methyl-accepting chemotaxis protein
VEQLSAAALSALEAIERATADATERARRIAESTADQDQRYAELRGRIQTIAGLSGRTRAEVHDVSTQAHAAARGLAELESATRELGTVADALREITGRFATFGTPVA